MKLVSIDPSTRKTKKFVALFSDGKRIHFGDSRYDDYTQHHSWDRQYLYRLRQRKHVIGDKDPTTPAVLSWYVLWGESTCMAKNIEKYRKTFNL
jgi:hypothetical protein